MMFDELLVHDEDWCIAVHEAGHAVFAALNNMVFQDVTLHSAATVDAARDAAEDDRVDTVVNPLDDDDFNDCEECIVVWQAYYAAGAAAEYLLCNGSIREHGVKGDKCCHQRLNEKYKMPTEFQESLELAIRELKGWATELRNVAIVLKCRRRLDEDQVVKIVGNR